MIKVQDKSCTELHRVALFFSNMNTHYILQCFDSMLKSNMFNAGLIHYHVTHGIPVGIRVIGNDVVTPCHQTLVDAG